MAKFLPNSPIGVMPPEIARMMRLLKSLPDEDFIVWHRLSIWKEPGPDFLILKNGSHAALLKVSSASPRDARAIIQPELIPRKTLTKPIGEEEKEAIGVFARKMNLNSNASEIPSIPALIAFPNISTHDLRLAAQAKTSDDVVWIPSEELRPERIPFWLEKYLSPQLGSEILEVLRKAFTPEVVIPATFTVRTNIERNTEAGTTDCLLDYDQEWVLKCDLELSEEAKLTAKDFNVRLVNGVAGSGKSLIIVYRVLLLRRLFPRKRVLALTHNRPLIHELKARYNVLNQGDREVEWKTFLSWCYTHWPKSIPWVKPIGQKARQKLIAEVWSHHLSDSSISPNMLETEIDWFKDRTLCKINEYLEVDRTGRGFALNESMRRRLFKAICGYQEKLESLGRPDWGDIPRHIWRFLQEGVLIPPQYDVVLIDEAQFFAPLWFEIIKLFLNPSTGHLFIVADPTQGFLRRRQSWLSCGLEVRGRSHHLDKSYRTTRSILDFATLLYRTRLPSDDEDIVVPNMLGMPDGVLPVVISVRSAQDEITKIVNEVVKLIQAGVPPQHILVIHTNWRGVESIIHRLCEILGPIAAIDPKTTQGRDHIRVCTLNAATGLESPIVFLADLKALNEEEQSLRISDEERMELIRDNTRRIYMAITRAGQRMVITYSGELPNWLNDVLEGRGDSPTQGLASQAAA